MEAGEEPRCEMWIVVSATSAIWTASLLAIAATAATAGRKVATTARRQDTGMAATADPATALRAIMGGTEEVGRQPAIRPIMVDNSTRSCAERRVWRCVAPSRRPAQ